MVVHPALFKTVLLGALSCLPGDVQNVSKATHVKGIQLLLLSQDSLLYKRVLMMQAL